ncbi:MAG: two-component system sensor histidine kinase NtrB [Planctomycetota bacterium]|jgi:PAS domain S-box-containing protein
MSQETPEGGQGRSETALEEELRHMVARYEAILASTLDPVITIDSHGVIVAASDSTERVFGWTPEELVGRDVSVLMPEPHRGRHPEYLERYRRTGETTILGRPRELEAVRRDGSIIPIELCVGRAEVPGGEPLFTGIIRDITEHKRAEDELRRYREHLEELVEERTSNLEASHEQLRLADRLASIGTLAAGLGHDMANILLPLRCRLDVLDAAQLPDALHQHFDAVRKSADYLQELADGLHLLSLDPEDAEASSEGTDLVAWWAQLGPLLARGLHRHVDLTTSLPDDLPHAAVPPHRLTQAMLNLVVNAGEAAGEDGQVHVWAESIDGGSRVRLGVSDNGVGMTPEVRRRAFDPFFTTKKRGLGTGLGLSLVQGVAHSAGGDVAIESEPEKGTTVRITLPTQVPAMTTEGDENRLRATVALLDPRIATLVSSLLETAGFEIHLDPGGGPDGSDLWVTDSSSEALALVRAGRTTPPRRMLVAGSGPDGLPEPHRSAIIQDPEDLEAWRVGIDTALGETA